jgi:hypothetical protein
MENESLQLGETTQEQIFAHMLTNEILFKKCKNQLSFKNFTNTDLSILVKIAFEVFTETGTTPTVEMIKAKINTSYYGADTSRRIMGLFDRVIASRDTKALPVIISELRIWKIAIISKDRCIEIMNAHNGKRYNTIPDLARQFVLSMDAIDFGIEEAKKDEKEIKIFEKTIQEKIKYLILNDNEKDFLSQDDWKILDKIQTNFWTCKMTKEDEKNLDTICRSVIEKLLKAGQNS